jgi:hypothetical protein
MSGRALPVNPFRPPSMPADPPAYGVDSLRHRPLCARHRLRTHSNHRLRPRRDARQPRRAGHRARAAPLLRPRGRLPAVLRPRPRRLPRRGPGDIAWRRHGCDDCAVVPATQKEWIKRFQQAGWTLERGGKHQVKMTKPGHRPVTLRLQVPSSSTPDRPLCGSRSRHLATDGTR